MAEDALIGFLKDEKKEVSDLNSLKLTPFEFKGIKKFYDIQELLDDPAVVDKIIEDFADEFGNRVDAIAAIDARGFIFGGALAHQLDVPMIMIRKKGKMPNVIVEKYTKEYEDDELCISASVNVKDKWVLIIDDILATGGTFQAAVNLLKHAGAYEVACACVIELKELEGRAKLAPTPVFSLIQK